VDPAGREVANPKSVAAEPSLDLGDGHPRVLQGASAYNVKAEGGTGDVHGAQEPAVGSDDRNRHARATILARKGGRRTRLAPRLVRAVSGCGERPARGRSVSSG
jgi:hypothetical protein